MAEKRQRTVNDSVRAQLLAGAYTAAAQAVEKRTTLRGANARRVAVETVNAALPKVRAEHIAGLAEYGAGTTAARLASLAVLAVDLAVFGAVAARGPRWARPLGAVSLVGHVGVYVFAKRRAARIRAAANAQAQPVAVPKMSAETAARVKRP